MRIPHTAAVVVGLLSACEQSPAPSGAVQPESSAARSLPPEPPRKATVLARLKNTPLEIVVDTDNAYVTEQDSSDPNLATNIVRIPLNGGAPTVLAPAQRNGQGLTMAAGSLFWLVSGDPDRGVTDAVYRVPVSGGVPTHVGNAFFMTDASLRADTTSIYFGDYADRKGSIIQMPLSGGPRRVVASTGEEPVSIMAIDSRNVYWVSFDTIKKAPLTGGATTTLASDLGAGNVWGMTSDDRFLYFTDRNNFTTDDAATGAVRRVPIEGGSVETIASKLRGRPWGIVADDTHVYWAVNSSRNGAIMRASKAGGPAVLLVAGQASPVHLTVDSTYVYWANAEGDRAVARAAKSP